ncbi:MAG: Crp/Fnr family transcriptional regulator [Acidobacteriia bacterium]|nr:Crp/Fnr family transcriptional regulator [Terriglobia bacterium]
MPNAAPYGMEMVESCLMCKMRNESFFCALPPRTLEAFEKIKFPSMLPRASVLFVEGQVPRGIYLLCRGRVKLSVNSSDGKTMILKIAEPGEMLGMHACVSNIPYELTAETVQTCQVVFIKRDDFHKFLEEHGSACLQAAQHLSANCHNAYDMIRAIGLSHSASEKLARMLLELAAEGESTKDGIRVKLALTHEEIAQVIGTSRETVTRLLGGFRKTQMATLRGSTLLIKNKSGLQKLVGS